MKRVNLVYFGVFLLMLLLLVPFGNASAQQGTGFYVSAYAGYVAPQDMKCDDPPVLDGEPGQELQVDTGWVGWLAVAERRRRRRRFRAWIFTAVYSLHRFVYPTFEETTARAIEA